MKKSLIKIKRKIWKLNRLYEAILFYFFSGLKKNSEDKKIVFINIGNGLIYHRYYYILIKYFLLENFQIYIKRDLRLIYVLITNGESFYLFKEKNIAFSTPPTNVSILEINDELVSPHYFNFIENYEDSLNEYYVPIGFHPYAYFEGFWKTSNPKKLTRKKSVFMAGNFYSLNYENRFNEKIFKVNNRIQIFNYLKKNISNYISFKNLEEFDEYLDSESYNHIIIVDRLNSFQIPPNRIFDYLERFDFFLALPGEIMPLCHNIIEAMSVGTIPFLQEGYAKVMRPPLISGFNCITFSDLDDLAEKIQYMFSLPQNKIYSLRKEVLKYFEDYLTPKAIVKQLGSGNYEKIYLMAESHSIALLDEDFSKSKQS